jgi:hypothetical protein
LNDKKKIINDLKNENEYFAEENSQLKAIITELKSEKSKLYEEKTSIIKSQNQEIEDLKDKLQNLNKINKDSVNNSEKIKFENDEQNKQIENLNLKVSQLE